MWVLFVVVFVELAERVYTSIGLWGLYHEIKSKPENKGNFSQGEIM
jgi:hypothetical protein